MDSSAQLIVQGFFADTRYACRTLRRSPSFAVVAVDTGNYFDVLSARGRDIDWRDTSDRPRAAVVNVFARTIFDNPDAVGARVRYGQNSEAIQVIGIVEDGKYMSLTE